MNTDQIIEKLKTGNANFVADKLDRKLQDSERKNELNSGQQPHTIILSCADSRVVPELTFDAGLGELFVVRVAGNIANTSSIASIEYAVAHLGSKVIVVLGHQSCGAVTAAVNGGDNGYNLNHLLAHIKPAIYESEDGADINNIVKINAKLNAKELVVRSSIIKDAVENKELQIIYAYYNLNSGKVDFLG